MKKIKVRRTLTIGYELDETAYPGMNIREIKEYELHLPAADVMEMFHDTNELKSMVDVQLIDVRESKANNG